MFYFLLMVNTRKNRPPKTPMTAASSGQLMPFFVEAAAASVSSVYVVSAWAVSSLEPVSSLAAAVCTGASLAMQS